MVALGIKVDRAATSIARKRVWMGGSLRGGGPGRSVHERRHLSRRSLSRSRSGNTIFAKSVKTEARNLRFVQTCIEDEIPISKRPAFP